MCLCKDCEATEITTWGDLAKVKALLLCLCCGGLRRIFHNKEKRCPNYRGR